MSTSVSPTLPPEQWLWQELHDTLDRPAYQQLRERYVAQRRTYNATKRREREQKSLQKLRHTLQANIRDHGPDHPITRSTRQSVERLAARLAGESEAA